MSSKSSRHRHDSSGSDSEAEGRKRHHHRHHHGHRERRRSRSRSRNRSPKLRAEKPERQSTENVKHNHLRDRDRKPLKHRDQDREDSRRRDRHHEHRRKEGTTEYKEKKTKWDHERDTDQGLDGRNGDQNHREGEDKHQMSTLRGKWENDPGAESDNPGDRGPRSRGNIHNQPGAGQIRIKQEREWNDSRRTQDSKRKPLNPFETSSGEAGPSENRGPPPEKEKPNFGTSGKLTEDTNTYRGVVIKYNEPPEARKPKRKWRFYVFKGDQELPIVHIHRQSAYLLGRERLIADLPIDHPSCSKQHAVVQYRLVQYERPDGSVGKRVRPYIIDLESSNGTYINNNRIESKRYYELHEKDVIKFGYSTREYVLLHDKSKDDNPDEDLDEV